MRRSKACAAAAVQGQHHTRPGKPLPWLVASRYPLEKTMKATVFMATTALLSVGQVLAGGALAEDSDASAPNKRPMPGDHGADDLPTPPPMHHDPMRMG